MASRSAILTAAAAERTIDWIAREGADAEYRAEAVLAGRDIGGLVDTLDRPGDAWWLGGGASACGLTGPAEISTKKSLFRDGILPDGMSVRSPQVKNAMIPVIISAPKSISALLAHPDRQVRESVDAALRAGAARAIETIEAFARARIGSASKGTITSVPGTHLVADAALHRGSSTGDPHAHVHIGILSTIQCQDGRWRAIDAAGLISVIRIATAAAHEEIEKKISSALGLTDDDWTDPRMVGSVQYREIKSLQKFIEPLSGAGRHMEAVAEEIQKSLKNSTNRENLWIWSQHRQNKALLAEAVEHEIDAALAAGDDAADAIRGLWDARCGGDLVKSLKKIKISKNPASTPAPQPLLALLASEKFEKNISILSKNAEIITKKIDAGAAESAQIAARIASERKSLRRFIPIVAGRQEIRLQDDAARLAALKKEAKIFAADLEKNHKKIERLRENHQNWEFLEKKCLSYLDGLHGWTWADVSAWIIGETGCDGAQAAQIAGRLLDRWVEKMLIKSPIAEKIAPLVAAILAGEEMAPERLYSIMGTKSHFVTTAALTAENDFAKKIESLTQTQCQRLRIDARGLDLDQSRAAEKIAVGRKFLPISGVAGGGKSFLMRPVADAARAAGLPVFATARNRKRATETGNDIGAHADAIFSIAAIENHLTPTVRARGGLLVIDEAGLIDRADWEKIVEIVNDSNLQIVAIGDRSQAQSIDRKGGWHIAHQAAGEHSAALFRSRRCDKWHAEHDDLRNGCADFMPLAEREGRIVPKIPEAAPGWIADRILAEPGAVAVTATNAEAAEISAAVQKKMKIEGKIPCRYGCRIGLGDRIRTRKNNRSLFVTNGDEFLVEKIYEDGSVRAKSTKNNASVTLPPAYLAENAELAYASTIDSAQGITVRRAIVCVTGSMGRSALYSGATRGTEAPIYLMTGSVSTAEAADVLTATLARDDIAPTLREIGERADAERLAAARAAEEAAVFAARLKIARGAVAERAALKARAAAAISLADPDAGRDHARGMGMR